jgi:hypothetical protein
MKQQTAVEWLEKQTRKPEWHSLKRGELFDQAKEIEKNQIIINYNQGCIDTLKDEMKRGEQYYKETFKKDE